MVERERESGRERELVFFLEDKTWKVKCYSLPSII